MLADQVLHQLEVVAPLGRRGYELRLEQLVEAEQRRIARELVLDQLRRGFGAFVRQDLVEQRVSRSSDGYWSS